MLSISSVRSAGGAASYFAKDNYYTREQSSEASIWGGAGAAMLGLAGDVEKDTFENLLNGKLPDGTQVGEAGKRRFGLDLTFNAPKSLSVLAYVTGDERLLAANMAAVKATMAWVEKKFAEGRIYTENDKGDPVRSGNLAYAMFQHDTSRKLDPQAHIHVVVANLTQLDGKWKALFNEALWKNNTVIGSAYHAYLREEVEKLGYETRLSGKHGAFEIEGVSKDVNQAYSQRREEILTKIAELGITTPQGRNAVAIGTRDNKITVEDRGALLEEWRERAAALGFDGKSVVEQANERASAIPAKETRFGTVQEWATLAVGTGEKIMTWLGERGGIVGELTDHVRDGLQKIFYGKDPLVTGGLARQTLTPATARAEMAVASAVRILSQRDAAFEIHTLSKTAMDLGLSGVTIGSVEARIAALAKKGELIFGTSDRADNVRSHVTTPEHLADERKLVEAIDAGKDASAPMLSPEDAVRKLQAAAGDQPLSAEQLRAAVMVLTSNDRTVLVQGVAGAGKTTMIRAIASVARETGRDVLGIAQANKMVNMLRQESGIEAQTVSSFVNAHIRGSSKGAGPAFEASKEALKDKIIILDEASLVATKPMTDVLTIVNQLGLQRLVPTGDFKQLQPIDAGKSFSIAQKYSSAEISELKLSQRQRTDHMIAAATLTRMGNYKGAFDALAERVVSAGVDYRDAAAKKWLELGADDRERTAVYTSGRETRAELNGLIQAGLKDEGTLRGTGLEVSVLLAANLTREELRYAHNYRAGQVLEVTNNSRPDGLARGEYTVSRTFRNGRVDVRGANGRLHSFRPERIDPTDRRDTLALYDRAKDKLHDGDRIVWTTNDKDRGIFNSDRATINAITRDGVEVTISSGDRLTLPHGDKMLERLNLAYAINMHQAQGMTTDMGIGVMHSAEQHLSNQRLFHVMVTRVRDTLMLFTNDGDKLLGAIERNPGEKASALEHTGKAPLRSLPGETVPGRGARMTPQTPPASRSTAVPHVTPGSPGTPGAPSAEQEPAGAAPDRFAIDITTILRPDRGEGKAAPGIDHPQIDTPTRDVPEKKLELGL